MDNGNGITKADLKSALTELKTELVDELTDKMRQIETNLLTEFAMAKASSCGSIRLKTGMPS